MNHFDPQHTAVRYAKGRPYFHRNTIQHIKEFLRPDDKLEQALDIACGTGLSTRALVDIATHVYGTDASAEMLKLARQDDKINYTLANAEAQPFANHTFDLITVCSGVHWFDIDAFLIEAGRLLKSKSWLILYDNFFLSEMKNVPEFSAWFPEVYLKKFPSPARNNTYDWGNENLNAKGFALLGEEVFNNEIDFTKEELILYFTTQSNIASAVESGMYDYPEMEAWLDTALSPFFKNDRRTLHFGNKIQYLQRLG